MAISSEKLVQEAIEISKESVTISEMLKRLSGRMKEMLGADEAVVKDVYQKESGLSQGEEAALSTKKPYLDNRLSGYSAFADLINYYNMGFKSCLMLPIATERNGFGIITLLSKREEGFDKNSLEILGPIGSMLGYELDSRLELERSMSMARYFDAVFEAGMPQFIVERSGRIVKANKTALNMLGMTQKEAAGAELGSFFSVTPEVVESIRAGRTVETKNLKTGRDFSLATRQISENLMYMVLYETTELRELENRAGLLGISQGEVFMLLNNDMKIEWVGGDQNALKIDHSGLIGRRIQSLVKDEEGKSVEARMRSIGKETHTEYATLRLGNDVEVGVDLTVRRTYNGFAVVVSKDVARYVESVGRSIEDVVSLFPEFVMMIDDEGFIRRANKSAERLLGYSSGELEGIPISKLCEEAESKDRMNSALDLAKRREVVTDLFVNLNDKAGKPVPITQNIKTLRSLENRVTGYMLMGKELGTKRYMEELQSRLDEMTRQAEKLKQESDLKTQFIFNVSHELKTPITNINGYARLLMGGSFGVLSEEQMESVKTIITEDDRLMQLIQQILDVAKLEAGKIKLDWQEVDLNDIRENPSIKSLEEMVKGKGLEYSFVIDYSVPRIEADPNRLIQVFVNLIVNAYKFTDRGSITIKAFRKGKNVRVEVRDTGIGINAEEKAKLFKRFYQLQKRGLTKQEGSGTGLGLSIVKEIVMLHGGRVGLGSETAVGKGSVFWFTLPIHRKPKKKEQGE